MGNLQASRLSIEAAPKKNKRNAINNDKPIFFHGSNLRKDYFKKFKIRIFRITKAERISR